LNQFLSELLKGECLLNFIPIVKRIQGKLLDAVSWEGVDLLVTDREFRMKNINVWKN